MPCAFVKEFVLKFSIYHSSSWCEYLNGLVFACTEGLIKSVANEFHLHHKFIYFILLIYMKQIETRCEIHTSFHRSCERASMISSFAIPSFKLPTNLSTYIYASSRLLCYVHRKFSTLLILISRETSNFLENIKFDFSKSQNCSFQRSFCCLCFCFVNLKNCI